MAENKIAENKEAIKAENKKISKAVKENIASDTEKAKAGKLKILPPYLYDKLANKDGVTCSHEWYEFLKPYRQVRKGRKRLLDISTGNALVEAKVAKLVK